MTRLDPWNRPIEPNDGKMGPWHDAWVKARRANTCTVCHALPCACDDAGFFEILAEREGDDE